jgi:transposase
MLDQKTRSAILRLHEEGHGARPIAHALGVSRGAVKAVLASGADAVPRIERPELAEPHRDAIMDLYAPCKGNLVRVHEELTASGATLSYQALTAFCRRHRLGEPPPVPAGRYEFAPGVEMQHDTSPHFAKIAGRRVAIQTASAVLAYSTMVFIQCYPRFTRFACKTFLTDTALNFEGVCERCMIDNTHVVVLAGSGRSMVPVPEMAAFSDRLGFHFVAHEIGDANRSAKVERRFDYIDNNFLAGREFADWRDLNQRARLWCDKVNATPRRELHASPRELFAAERRALKPLPIHVPEVYQLHHRIVDGEGFVNVQRVRYSAPWRLIGRQLEVRETRDRIEIFDGPRLVAEHPRPLEDLTQRVCDPSHRPPRGEGLFARHRVSSEETRLLERAPHIADYLALMKARGRASVRSLRALLRMVDEYPRDAFAAALDEAARFGMTDVDRLDRMVLQRIAGDFFPPPADFDDSPYPEDNDD